MSALPHLAKEIDLLRWVAANPNKPFDPNMVVSTSTGHTDDWEWQAVLHQMEELARLNYIRKIKQDSGGSTYWTITERGESYLNALERAETANLETAVADSISRPQIPPSNFDTVTKPVTATIQSPLAQDTRPFPSFGEEQAKSDRLSRETIDRFTDRTRTIFEIADHFRLSTRRPAISTIHLIRAFAAQPEGQFPQMLRESDVSLDLLIPPRDDMPEEGSLGGITSSAGWQLPPVTDDVQLALLNARQKANELLSATIDDSHVLYGLLSVSGTDNLLIQELNRRGVIADKVRLATATQSGPSTHVARDRWTVDDSLGYFPYAYAIYRFLTDKNTAPPLAISIQAPWGGGKTSLMRMVQAQLDPASLRRDQTPPPERKRATVKDVIAEIERLSSTQNANAAKRAPAAGQPDQDTNQVPQIKPPTNEDTGERRVTIWFNAWKYESTAQVWAGLADTIVRQVSDRLGPVERELFWLRLQLRRIDTGEVRRRIHEQILLRFWQKLPHWAWAYVLCPAVSLFAVIFGRVVHRPGWEVGGWVSAILTTAASLVAASLQLKGASSEVERQPADLSLAKIVEVPDYRANLGFVHHVTDDLGKVFETIPKKYLPMVIFIDDLDRCSPSKISDVIEAVNLFLAGEFPDCMFVLGIDDEMVAAALDKAHSDVISRMPSYAKSGSIGWRFMDKFVQLPFIVPPPTPEELRKYADSLFSQDSPEVANLDIEARNEAAEVIERSTDIQETREVVEKVATKRSLTNQQRRSLTEEVAVMQQMNQNIKAFSDEEAKIKKQLAAWAIRFSVNPRDIKRFINVFRFYYFLRAAREARGQTVPSLRQLSCWILFSLKWPEAVRYLSRAQAVADTSRRAQVELLEKCASQSQDVITWRKRAAESLGIESSENCWFWSEEIMRFFQHESTLPASDRLSTSFESGLW
ncbi:MAG TPA: P-loop NTPase fold protein [Candidatus Acidoferrum sp.]|nr:P-loop NTPase fold protein [Candidatus Acidoferrum sp.]